MGDERNLDRARLRTCHGERHAIDGDRTASRGIPGKRVRQRKKNGPRPPFLCHATHLSPCVHMSGDEVPMHAGAPYERALEIHHPTTSKISGGSLGKRLRHVFHLERNGAR